MDRCNYPFFWSGAAIDKQLYVIPDAAIASRRRPQLVWLPRSQGSRLFLWLACLLVSSRLLAANSLPGRVVGWGAIVLPDVKAGTAFTNIAAKVSHNLAIKKDGTVVAWGYDQSQQAIVPPGLGNVVAVSPGSDHCLALRNDGTVAAWGGNYWGETNVPVGLSNVVAISAGWGYSLALQSDGKVIAWGGANDQSGVMNVPADLSNAVAIAAGGSHNLALKSDGTVASWGSFPQWTVPEGLSNVIAIAAGYDTSLALKDDGTVVAWGGNWCGRTNVPTGLTNVVAIAANAGVNLALRRDGTVVAWGCDDYGQANVPPDLTNVVAIAAGGGYAYESYCLALKADGTIAAWGRADFGETAVPGSLDNVVAIAASGYTDDYGDGYWIGWSYGLALKSDGTVVGWGDNYWDVEAGFDMYYGPADPPPGLSNVVAISTCWPHSLALKADGTVVGWGTTYQTAPLASLSNIVAIAAGGGHDLALRSDGTVVAWGANDYGQTNVPAGLSNVVAIAAGQLSSLALRNDGTLFLWGGVVGPMQTDWTSNIVAIAAGGVWGWDANAAMRNDGFLFAWCGGEWPPYNPMGSSCWFSVDYTAQPCGIMGVAAGDFHLLALRRDGQVLAVNELAFFGINYTTATDVPAGLSNVVAVAAAIQTSLALVADPRISAITLSDQGPVIRFHTFAGQQYSVESSPDLTPGGWLSLPGGPVLGDGNDALWTDTTSATETARFYRLKLLSP